MGGIEAEKLIFGEANITSGASGDITEATDIAVNMVKEYSMYSANGKISAISDATMFSKMIKNNTYEGFIESIIRDARKDVAKILLKHKKQLLKLTHLLTTKQKVLKDEIKEVLSDLYIVWKDTHFEFHDILQKALLEEKVIDTLTLRDIVEEIIIVEE